MRALLISHDGITEIDLPGSNDDERLAAMQDVVGCRLLTGAGYPDRHHAAWADDEGTFTLGSGSLVTTVDWHPERLVGNLLITGFGPEGETLAATMTVAELSRRTNVGLFIRPEDMGAL